MAARSGLVELVWPLAPGGVLLFSGALVAYALRGPQVDVPTSSTVALATLVGTLALGHLARLAASGAGFVVHALWAVDLFMDRPASELIDELSPRRLSPELVAKLDEVLEARFGLGLSAIAANEPEASREQKTRRVDEVIVLARSGAGSRQGSGSPEATTARASAWLEARADGARALFAALVLGGAGLLFVAAHDSLFARSVAHALSGFTLVVTGLTLLGASFAALRRARATSRRLALEALLSILNP